MKLEQQVTNKELSQRLAELGVKQMSYFRWSNLETTDSVFRIVAWEHISVLDEEYSAYTVAELGEILPDECVSHRENKDWYCKHINASVWEKADTEANARAKMLIYLIENKLL